METNEARFLRRSDCVTREIAGETIIVPVRGNVGDLDSIYTLNEVGTKVWRLLDGSQSVGQVVEAVCNEYEVSSEEATRDVMVLLGSLQEAGLIAPASEQAG